MIKILFKKESQFDKYIHLDIHDLTCTVNIRTDDVNEVIKNSTDTIENMIEYNSYALIDRETRGKVKVYRKILASRYNFIDLCRMGIVTKLDFADIIQLYGINDIMQIDTGICVGNKIQDMVIRVFNGDPSRFTIDTNYEYEIGYFSYKDLETGEHPRYHLWDYYALQVNGRELQADRYGNIVAGDFASIIKPEAGKDYVEFTIQKYKGHFENPLNRDIDDEDVIVESTIGLVNNRRVHLHNGKGTFRLYPFGATGEFKLKLGRRWYTVWDEYNLIMG